MVKIPVTNQDWLEVIALKRQEAIAEGRIAGLKEAAEICENLLPATQEYTAAITLLTEAIEALRARIAELEAK